VYPSKFDPIELNAKMTEQQPVSGFINPGRALALGLEIAGISAGPSSIEASPTTARPRSRSRDKKRRSRSRDRKRRSRTRDRSRSSGRKKEAKDKEKDKKDREKDKKSRRSRSRSKSGKRVERKRSRSKSEKKRSRSRSEKPVKEKKKKNNWDLPPADLAAQQLQQMSASLSPWTAGGHNVSAQSIQSISSQALQGIVMSSNVINSQVSLGAGQLTKKARTVYVGNLITSITEADLRGFFNSEIPKVSGRPPTYEFYLR
jgi:hypothetical protein